MDATILGDVTALKTRLGIDINLTAGDDVLSQALYSAQIHLENALDTQTQQASWHNIFFMDKHMNNGIHAEGTFSLLLTSGFIKNVNILSGDKWNLCTVAVPTEDYILNTEQGFVFIDREKYVGKYLKITFDTGLAYDDAPAWLLEAIYVKAPDLFNLPVLNTDARGPRDTPQTMAALIANHVRLLPTCLRPLYKDKVA